jgi:hypothetical protein
MTTAQWYSFPSLSLKSLKRASLTSLRSGFRNGFILDPLRANAIIVSLLFFFSNCLDRRIYETKFPTQVSFLFFPFCTCCVALTVIISEADALMYVVLSKAETHVPYGG